MLHTGNYLADQLLIPFVLWFFIVASLVGVVLQRESLIAHSHYWFSFFSKHTLFSMPTYCP
jgi:lipopolysaccharide export LptBFGC system permease protein LptF